MADSSTSSATVISGDNHPPVLPHFSLISALGVGQTSSVPSFPLRSDPIASAPYISSQSHSTLPPPAALNTSSYPSSSTSSPTSYQQPPAQLPAHSYYSEQQQSSQYATTAPHQHQQQYSAGGYIQSTPPYEGLRHGIKRESHKEIERKRREAINDGIKQIADLIPPEKVPESAMRNKGAILHNGARYMRELQQSDKMHQYQMSNLQLHIQVLTRQNQELRQKLAMYEQHQQRQQESSPQPTPIQSDKGLDSPLPPITNHSHDIDNNDTDNDNDELKQSKKRKY